MFLLFFVVFTTLNAQVVVTDKAYHEARDHMYNLQEGVLVVYLPTNGKKLAALKSIVDRNPNDKRAKSRYETLKIESKALQIAMIDAYQEYYSFSKVYFMPDTMGYELKSGTQEGIFVNKQLELTSEIKLENDNYYRAYIGEPTNANSTGKKSILIEDKDGQLLASPFPYATRFYSFLDVLTNNSDSQIISKVVIRQQKKLVGFEAWNKKQELKGRANEDRQG